MSSEKEQNERISDFNEVSITPPIKIRVLPPSKNSSIKEIDEQSIIDLEKQDRSINVAIAKDLIEKEQVYNILYIFIYIGLKNCNVE